MKECKVKELLSTTERLRVADSNNDYYADVLELIEDYQKLADYLEDLSEIYDSVS